MGEYCWLGAGSVILPNVTLGPFTIVGAGSVVSRSVPDGYCIVVGNPARIVRKLEPDACIRHKSAHEYHGFIPKSEFEEFRAKELRI